MHRLILESLVSSAASLLIGAVVLVAGASMVERSAPPIRRPEVGATLADPATRPGSTRPAGASCQGATVVALGKSRVRSSAGLCRDEAGIYPWLELADPTTGHAYTVLFAYFDRAVSCRAVVCHLDDTLGQNPAGVLTRLDGGVASDGATRFQGQIRDLQPAPDSQIVLFLFETGYASNSDNRLRARQLLTPRSPRLGAPGTGPQAEGEAGTPIAYAAFEFRRDP